MSVRERIDAVRTNRSTVDSGWALANEIMTLVSMLTAFWLLSKELGAEPYGLYVSMFALAGPATAFSTAGVSLTIYEHAARLNEDARRVAQSCLTITTLIGLAATAVLVPISRWTIADVPVMVVVAFFLAELVFSGWSQTAAAVVQATEGFIPATKIRLGITGTRVVLLAALAMVGHLNLESLAATWILGTAVLAIVNTFLAGRSLGGTAIHPGPSSWAHLKSTGLYSFGISAVNVQNDGDKVALTASGHIKDAGLYGAAYRIVQIGLMPINAVAASTHISFLEAGQEPDELVRRARKFSLMSAGYGLVAGAALWFAAPIAPALLDDFAGTETIIRALIPLLIIKGIGTFAMNALLGLGRNRLRTTILIGNAAFSVALYALLVPSYSWKGAAIATAVAEATSSLLAWTALLLVRRTARPTAEDIEFAIATDEAESISGHTT